MALVSVIVPAYNAAATLGRTLDAIAAQAVEGGFETVVVDDGSSDDTGAIAAGREGVAVVRHESALGPAAARNAGVAAAGGNLLAFTDADCFPQPGWLAAGVAALERWSLVQGRVVPDPDAPAGAFDRTISVSSESGLYETANMLVRREDFERLGGFEEWLAQDTGKPMAEDVWLGWRARRAGMATGFAADAVVHHAVFPRTAAEYVAERARLRHFPAMVKRIPELRAERFYGRIFLSRRSAAFDMAVAGLAAAAVSRSWRPLVAAVPYGAALVRQARAAPRQAAVEVAADAVSFAALARGSAHQRCLLI